MTRHPARPPANVDQKPRSWRLWIDMETSGLEPEHDYVLEAAAVLIAPEARIVERLWMLNTQIVGVAGKAKPGKVAELMPPAVADMHTRNGLIDDLCHTRNLGDTIAGGTWPWTIYLVNDEAGIDNALCQLLADEVPERDKVTIAGSGVAHFDVPWMRDQGWQLPERCTYWQHDVGAARRWLAGCGITVDAPASAGPAKTHRAVDDVLAHMEEDTALQCSVLALKAGAA